MVTMDVSASMSLRTLKKSIDEELARFFPKGFIRTDYDEGHLYLYIGDRDIELNKDMEVVGGGTVIGEHKLWHIKKLS